MKPKKAKRSHTFIMRVTANEKAALKYLAYRTGRTMSEILRLAMKLPPETK